jgi:tRNA G10  N-methylase Trm11
MPVLLTTALPIWYTALRVEGYPMGGYVLTCKQGTNADLFPDILKLYVPEESTVLDATYGRGVFWKNIDEKSYTLIRNDLDPSRGDESWDFRNVGLPDSCLDAFILDPPYLYVGGFRTLKKSIDRGYQNAERALEQEIHGKDAVMEMYRGGIAEAARCLKAGGVLIVKGMDQVESGKVSLFQVEIFKMLDERFEILDLFVLMVNGQPTMRHKTQVHARRNHSYFLILRRTKS